MKLNYKDNKYEILASKTASASLTLIKDIIDKFIIIEDNRLYQEALFKDDKAHNVFKYQPQKTSYYIKKYENLKLKKKIKNLFRPAEGERYLKLLNMLHQINIPTINKAWAIKYGPSFNQESLFITEEIEGQELINFLEKCNDQNLRKTAIKNLAQLLNTLYANKLISGDPNFSNFFVDEKSTVKFIDLDSIKKFPVIPKKLIYKNLAKLLALAYIHEAEISPIEKELLINNTLKTKQFQKILKLTRDKLAYWNHSEIIQNNSELSNI